VPQGGGGPGQAESGGCVLPTIGRGGPAAVDVTILHPLAPGAPVGARAGVEQWRTRQAEDKRAKYEADCGRLGWKFVPVVMDTFGGLGKGGLECVGYLVKEVVGQREGWERRGRGWGLAAVVDRVPFVVIFLSAIDGAICGAISAAFGGAICGDNFWCNLCHNQ